VAGGPETAAVPWGDFVGLGTRKKMAATAITATTEKTAILFIKEIPFNNASEKKRAGRFSLFGA
jgi:hypothetical protein